MLFVWSDIEKVKTMWGDFMNNEMTWHIVIGESAWLSVKLATNSSRVIGLKDNLSYGPILYLDTKKGIENRLDWLTEKLSDVDHYSYDTLKKLRDIAPYEPIIIWTADNGSEQTGLRYVMYLLKDWSNDIYILNTTSAYNELIGNSNIVKTTELSINQLKEIYEKFNKKKLLDDRKRLVEEWKALRQTEMNLRAYSNYKIVSKNEAAYDAFIIETAKKIHVEMQNEPYIKAARIVGEVYGELQDFDDLFIEYRLREMIEEGYFDYKGDLSAMRFYEVRLKDSE